MEFTFKYFMDYLIPEYEALTPFDAKLKIRQFRYQREKELMVKKEMIEKQKLKNKRVMPKRGRR